MKGYLAHHGQKKCKICKGYIAIGHNGYKEGHNAEPVTKGRCCSDCNDLYVIPERLNQLFKKSIGDLFPH